MPPAQRYFQRYTCVLDSLLLSVRETDRASAFDVRVVRKPREDVFSQALIIRPGTVLKLRRGANSVRFVKVRVFIPRIQYGGRFVAGGVIEIEESG
jgi:hypothetical protein